jgi:hypothetical protein
MQHRIRLTLVAVLLAACSSAPGTKGGGTGGEEETGGSSGGDTGGKSGGTGGKASSTGGSTGSTGGSSGTTGGSTGSTGGTSGSTGGSSGSTGGAGATADAGAPDGPPAATGGCGMAKFCADFEDQMAGAAPTGMFKVTGPVTVDTTRAFSGTKSVTYKNVGGSGAWLTFAGMAASLPENDLHGRMMIFMPATPGKAHFDTIMATGTGTGTYILGGMYGNFMSVYHPGDCSVDSKTPFPTNRWACIQWEFKGTKDGKHLHKMMLDGMVVDNGIQDGSQGFCVNGGGRDWKAPIFDNMKVGHVAYGGGSISLWIDDLAWGPQEIPCPPPKP